MEFQGGVYIKRDTFKLRDKHDRNVTRKQRSRVHNRIILSFRFLVTFNSFSKELTGFLSAFLYRSVLAR